MILILLSIALCIVYTLFGVFHFYWLFGGTWGLSKVIPSTTEKVTTLAIPKFATLVVAVVFIIFGSFYLIKANVIKFNIPIWLSPYIYWSIPSIFILRAIGEFKYVGFFKTIKHTEFAKADSTFFSPLCLGLGSIGFLIECL